jgi:REP element-mobilizing transposase RayT
MPRKPRIEIGGGLYHVITRGNNRRKIFRSRDDYLSFTNILQNQKAKLPFFLYAYCLMPNHVHLLIEMQDEPISRIMQRVLTAYSQYHNRKYKKIGHLFQGRYKSILCQTDRYLGELVRYIHLNPVRGRIVRKPEDFEFSGHRTYLGLDKAGLVDVEPVLRHFGPTRRRAIEVYCQFVEASLDEKSQDNYYRAAEGRLLGSEEFLETVRDRVGGHKIARPGLDRTSIEDLLIAATRSSDLSRQELCGKSKPRTTVAVREAMIVVGRERGLSNRELAEALEIDPSAVTRRLEAVRRRGGETAETVELRKALKDLTNEIGKMQQSQA